MVHGDSQCLSEQCEQPEDAATEPEDLDDDLGVAALDEEVNQLLTSEGGSDSEIDLAAGANAGANAGDSNSDSNSDSDSAQSSEPGANPEDTEPEDCQWSDGLGVAALDEEVN